MPRILEETRRKDPVTGQELVDTDTGETIVAGPAGLSADSMRLFQDYQPKVETSPIAPSQSAVAAPITPEETTALKATLAASPPASAAPFVGPPVSAAGSSPTPVAQPAPALPSIPPVTYAEATQTQDTFNIIPPKLQKEQDKLLRQKIDTIGKEEALLGKVAEIQLEQAEAKANEIADFNRAEEDRRFQEEAEITKRFSDIEATAKQYEGMKVDADRYWANKSTGSKILAAIGIALGGYAQAMGVNKENPALSIIRAAIDNDIRAQEANIATFGKALDTQRGIYSDLVRRTGDKQEARLKTYEMGLKAADAQFAAVQASTSNEFVQVQAQKERDTLQQEILDTQTKLQMRVRQVVTERKPIATGPDPTKAPVAVVEQADEKRLEDAYAAASIWHKLSKIQDTWKNENITGPLIGPALALGTKLGVVDDEGFIKSNTAQNMARFQLLKAITGAGVNVQEMAQYEKILPSINKPEDVNRAITEYLKEDYASKLDQTKTAVASRYGGDGRVLRHLETAYPSFSTKAKEDKYGAKRIGK